MQISKVPINSLFNSELQNSIGLFGWKFSVRFCIEFAKSLSRRKSILIVHCIPSKFGVHVVVYFTLPMGRWRQEQQ